MPRLIMEVAAEVATRGIQPALGDSRGRFETQQRHVDGFGLVSLSSYPADKIVAACTKCGLRKRFDKAGVLKAGGDRPLGLLLDDIAVRFACPRRKATPNIYDKCGIVYPELVDLMKGAGKISEVSR